jgi:hypothetical protein
MSLEYEISNILMSLDNIDDAFHIDWDDENEDKAYEEGYKVREFTSKITEECYDLINYLKTRGKYEERL